MIAPFLQPVEELLPMLVWLHSKKHGEDDKNGPWHRAWRTVAEILAGDRTHGLLDLEHAVHDYIGIPTDDCQCEICHG